MNGPRALLPDLPAPLRHRYHQQMERATLGAIDTALAGPVAIEVRTGEQLLRFEPMVLEPAVEYFESLADRGSGADRPTASTLHVLELRLGAPDVGTLSCACDLRAHLRSNLTMARSLPVLRHSIHPLDADPELHQRAQRLAERAGSGVVVGLFQRLPRGAVRAASIQGAGRQLRLRLERDTPRLLQSDCLVAISLPEADIQLWWLEAECQLGPGAVRLAPPRR